MKIKLSKAQWEQMGNKAGWISKQANGWGRFSGDLSDILEGQAVMGVQQNLSVEEVVDKIKADNTLAHMLVEESATLAELTECIKDNMRDYKMFSNTKGVEGVVVKPKAKRPTKPLKYKSITWRDGINEDAFLEAGVTHPDLREVRRIYDETNREVGDAGSCVLGNSLKVNGVEAVRSRFQGSFALEIAQDKIMDFLKPKYPYIRFQVEYGRMD